MYLNAALSLVRAAALSAALFLLGSLVPIVGAVLMLCAPAPLLIGALGRPHAAWRMAAVMGLCLAMITLAAGPWQGLGFVVSFGLATAVIFVLLRRRTPFELIVVAAAAVTLAAIGTTLMVWAGSPAALVSEIRNTLAQATSHADQFYQKMGFSLVDSQGINAEVLDTTVRLMPGLGAIAAALMVLLNLALTWRWLREEGLGYQLFGGLTRWRAPEWMIWLLLATGFGLFLPLAPWKTAAGNGFLFITAIYFCQGLAIMAYYFQVLSMPVVARGMIYLITLVQPILAALVCLAGIFDMWIDFRRLKPPSQEAGSLDDFL